MCGGGISWSYKPTPQPGDFIKAKICSTCGKRAKRAAVISTRVTRTTPRRHLSIKDGEVAWRKSRNYVSDKTTQRAIQTCCTDNHTFVYGRVERTRWSHYKNGVIKDFFLIVFVPSSGKRHWATLETIELVSAVDYLIHNVPEDQS
jgi:hypothetical protein